MTESYASQLIPKLIKQQEKEEVKVSMKLYNILATGSSGNAIIYLDTILVDVGVSQRKLSPFLDKLELVLLTHIHGDHFKESTILNIHKKRPTVRFGCGVAIYEFN